jgi:hypothetical protein
MVPTLSNSHFVVEFWNVVRKSYDQQIDASKRIQHILSRLPEDVIDEIKSNDLDYEEAVRHAITIHDANIRNHYGLRRKHMEQLVDDLNERYKTNKSTTVKGIMRREESRQDFQKLRRVFKGTHGKGITTLEIPDSNNPDKWNLITIPAIIETKLIVRI